MIVFGRNILTLFVSGSQNEINAVLEVAYHYLFIMAVCYRSYIYYILIEMLYRDWEIQLFQCFLEL